MTGFVAVVTRESCSCQRQCYRVPSTTGRSSLKSLRHSGEKGTFFTSVPVIDRISATHFLTCASYNGFKQSEVFTLTTVSVNGGGFSLLQNFLRCTFLSLVIGKWFSIKQNSVLSAYSILHTTASELLVLTGI